MEMGWDIEGRGTMAILAIVNVANVLNINCKMGLLQLQRKTIHVSRLFIELIPTN
jgi:kynureninase